MVMCKPSPTAGLLRSIATFTDMALSGHSPSKLGVVDIGVAAAAAAGSALGSMLGEVVGVADSVGVTEADGTVVGTLCVGIAVAAATGSLVK